MRIAWVTYDFEEYSSLHVNELAAENEVLLVMPKSSTGDVVCPVRERVQHYAFDKPRLRQPLRQLWSINQIKSRIRAFRPDVVHWQQGHLWFNTAIPSLKRYPLVVTIHDPQHHAGDKVSQKTPQWVMDYGFRRADHAIVHGKALASQVRDLFGFPDHNIHVIPHVAMGRVESGKKFDEEPGNVLFFGRIWDYKGLEYLIRAEPLISKEYPNLKIVIGGEGDDFSKYRKMIGDSPRFEVHNRWISDEERAEFFQRASVVVLPYTEATQSGVVPVAYTHSRPVVATRVGALAECIDDGETGLLVEPRDPQELANAIVRLLKDSTLRHRMGSAGYQRVLSESSPHTVAQRTIQVYRQAVGS